MPFLSYGEVMETLPIKAGDKVRVITIDGSELQKRAASDPQMSDFLIVRVCREEEWVAAKAEDRPPRSVAWPAEDVELLEPYGSTIVT